MAYKQIKPRKIYEEVADELLNMIKTGDLKPGDKLNSVQKLAEDFSVGRSAIREALSALRAKGMLEMRQGEGTYIREFDPKVLTSSITSSVLLMGKKDIHDLLEIRKILEVGSVNSAVENAQESDILAISKALADMQDANGDEQLGEKADLQFHMALAEASHNRFLIDLMNNVSETMVEAMFETRRIWLFSQQRTLTKIYQQHKQIFEAIESRDSVKAQELMLNHLTEVEQTLLKYYQ
ncbi:FadR/GntR family transcriptional regulator [Halobacillus naozhouensis]|uniref:FadR/GntR family transcriptional regulator n=1 Tax=Halobacillus naozhouensis TaxID=554880 RepID=A0ABY8IYR8_9BACI|nr:FadR/GntR family transcriptional regulator [Halobacillus naozhouensis]WFT74517.1 FadR/GntR family transcriptional regulator [Halobacillus naozhouensis]